MAIVWVAGLTRSDYGSGGEETLAVHQQTDRSHDGGAQLEQHRCQNEPVSRIQSIDSSNACGFVNGEPLLIAEEPMLHSEGCAPDEKDDPVPEEEDGNIVVRDDEGYHGEDDCSDKGDASDGLRENLHP